MAGNRLMDPSGWEAFVHGVFAITITLLVLDIRVPPIDRTPDASALLDALVAEWPRYLAYLLSFLYVGAYWIGTHRSLRMSRAVDHVMLVIGLVYLLSIAVVPFVSALLAEYVAVGDGRSQVVVVVFLGWQLVVNSLAFVVLLYSSRSGLLRADLDPADVRRWLRLALAAPLIWAVAFVVALVIGAAALAFPMILLAAWLWERPGMKAGRT